MKLLEEKIQKEGEVLGDDILRVDSFVSHQVDLPLMEELGKDMAEHFRGQGVTKVFTIESSGIAPAVFNLSTLKKRDLKPKQLRKALKTTVDLYR